MTCVLQQGTSRVLAHLDENGEMRFASADFETGKEIEVYLYSHRRQFPKLGFKLEENEKEYELVEVKGPYPWWKVALEILAVLACGVGLLCNAVVWRAIFNELPLIFA